MAENEKLTKEKIDQKKIDKGASTYVEIRRYIDDRIDALRQMNDATVTEQITATTRGRISELKKLIKRLEPQEIKYVSQNQ